MDKKYELIPTYIIEFEGCILYQIVALKDFGYVKKGEKGGWIQSEQNLSQEGNCWVYDNAKVYFDARVYDDATVCNNARVGGDAQVCGQAGIYDDAYIFGNAKISENAEVQDHARVSGNAEVYGHAKICGISQVCEDAKVCGDTYMNGNATVRVGTTKSEDDYIVIGPFGSNHSYITYHIPSNTVCVSNIFKVLRYKATLENFENDVKKKYENDEKYLNQYKWLIETLKGVKK